MSRVDAGLTTSEIVKDVNILKVITWIQEAWRGVEDKTIKNCFEKCGFSQPDTRLYERVDEEFEELTRKHCPDTSIDDSVSFGDCIETCQHCCNVGSVAWREDLRVESIQAAIHGDARDEDIDSDDKDIDPDDDVDEDLLMDVESEEFTANNALEIFEKLQSFFESHHDHNHTFWLKATT